MYLVFGFSAQDATESSGLSLRIASLFSDDVKTQHFFEPYIRKLAHFSEYGMGGALVLSLFSTFRLNEIRQILFSTCIGIIYASTDEIHQLFVPGRTGKLIDVIIDSLGFITGLCFLKLCIEIYKKINKREIYDKK